MPPSRSCPAAPALPPPVQTSARLAALTRRVVLVADLARWETDGGALAGSLYPPPKAGGTRGGTMTVAGRGLR